MLPELQLPELLLQELLLPVLPLPELLLVRNAAPELLLPELLLPELLLLELLLPELLTLEERPPLNRMANLDSHGNPDRFRFMPVRYEVWTCVVGSKPGVRHCQFVMGLPGQV